MKLKCQRILIYLLLPALLVFFVISCWHPWSQSVMAHHNDAECVLIIDAGHGGADGGAVSADGIQESQLNLEITRRLALLMLFCGQQVALTRSDEQDLSSPDAATIKEQKVSDLNNRVRAINSAENATLISIHQNSLAGHPEVAGAQVFYNHVAASSGLAVRIQAHLNLSAASGKPRVAKQIDSSIYLMKEVNCPAVLVECGFLSNLKEARDLCTPEHQKQLAAAIAAGYLSYTNEGST